MNDMTRIVAAGQLAVSIPHSPSADPDCFHEAPGALGSTIRLYFRGVGIRPESEVVAAARVHVSRLNALCEPASDAVVLEWIRAMGAGVAKAGDSTENVAGRVRAVFATCRHLPVGVWTEQTRIAFWAAHRWWPEPADLLAFLRPYATALDRQRAGCEAVIVMRGEHDGEPEPVVDLAERKRIGAEFKARALAAIAEGASLLNIPSAAAARKPIVRTRTDDLARLGMLKARAANASSEPVRRACAQTARELEARLMGEGVRT